MAGKPGRSGGANRRSVEHHVALGNYRPSRHGPKLPSRAAVETFPVLPESVPAPLLSALGAAGGAFVADCWREYKGWTTPQALLLQRAGQLVDLELQARTSGDVRLWTSIHKLLLATIAALGLREACKCRHDDTDRGAAR